MLRNTISTAVKTGLSAYIYDDSSYWSLMPTPISDTLVYKVRNNNTFPLYIQMDRLIRPINCARLNTEPSSIFNIFKQPFYNLELLYKGPIILPPGESMDLFSSNIENSEIDRAMNEFCNTKVILNVSPVNSTISESLILSTECVEHEY